MAKTAPEKPMNPRAKGFKLVGIRLAPAHIAALKREALRRANDRGVLRLDISELVREALDAWLRRR
jgi:hypothetical protein